MDLTQALAVAVTTLAGVVVHLWRENVKWQERWAEEVRSHSKSSELFNSALEKLLSESYSRTDPPTH